MIHLIFSILCSTSILIIFRSLEKFEIGLFHTIILNYITASALGMILLKRSPVTYYLGMAQADWFFLSAFIGVLLIVMFFLTGFAAQKVGLTITTISTKMSVAIPMIFSMLYYNEPISKLKWAGILLAVVAVALTSVKGKSNDISIRYLYIPVMLFLGLGSLGVIVKYVQHKHLFVGHSALFTGAAFTWAFLSGLIACLIKKITLKTFFKTKVLLVGIILGICNFGSIFFIVNALNSNVFESSIVFGTNSIGIVTLSVFSAITMFREKLLWINWAGVGLAACATLAWIYA